MSTDKFGKAEIAHPESKSDHTPETVLIDAKRRRLAKLGVGAPVMMSLASRPVFGGQCLSNMMSGNLSDPNRGNCTKGWSPGGWGKPGGMVGNYTTAGAWSTAGFWFGNLANNCNMNQMSCWSGGTKFSLPSASGLAALNKGGSTTYNIPWRLILTEPSTYDQLTRHLICAYLNAALSEVDQSFTYILTKAQVLALAGPNPQIPPGYSGLQDFLSKTW